MLTTVVTKGMATRPNMMRAKGLFLLRFIIHLYIAVHTRLKLELEVTHDLLTHMYTDRYSACIEM